MADEAKLSAWHNRITLNEQAMWTPVEPTISYYNNVDSSGLKEEIRRCGPIDDHNFRYLFEVAKEKVNMGVTLHVLSDILGVNLYEPEMIKEILYHVHVHCAKIENYHTGEWGSVIPREYLSSGRYLL